MPRKNDPNALSPRELKFVELVAAGIPNGKAAEQAGWSPAGASAQASALLKKPKIEAAIQGAIERNMAKVGLSPAEILGEVALIAMSDVSNYEVDQDTGKLKTIDGVPREAMRAVSSVEIESKEYFSEGGKKVKSQKVKFRLWNKNNALELAGRNQGLFPNTVKGNIGITLDDLLKDTEQGDG